MTQLHQEHWFHDEARAEYEMERSRFLQHNDQLQCTIDATLQHQEQLKKALDSLQEVKLESSSVHNPSLSSPMKKLLGGYNELDDDSKKALLTTAITSNNMDLQ